MRNRSRKTIAQWLSSYQRSNDEDVALSNQQQQQQQGGDDKHLDLEDGYVMVDDDVIIIT